jgi:hypothetical protein
LDFFGFQVFFVLSAPVGEKRNPNPVLGGSGLGSGRGCKNAPGPAPSSAKPAGDPKPKPELPSLHKVNLAAINRRRRFKAMMN